MSTIRQELLELPLMPMIWDNSSWFKKLDLEKISSKLLTANRTLSGTNKEEKSDFALVSKVLTSYSKWKKLETHFGSKLQLRAIKPQLWKVSLGIKILTLTLLIKSSTLYQSITLTPSMRPAFSLTTTQAKLLIFREEPLSMEKD